MRSGKIGKRLASVALVAGGAAIVAASWAQKNAVRAMDLLPSASAATPRVIDITARKYEFSPAEITLKRNQPVILRLSSADRTHGFLLRPLKIDTDITPGKTTELAITPHTAGRYVVICDHYCGTGHGNMKMTLTVT